MADYTFIDLFPELSKANHDGSFNAVFGDPLLNPGGIVTITHLVMTGVALVIIVVLALLARRKYSNREEAIVPERKLSVRNFFEVIFDAVLSMMTDMMGREHARRFFPLIAALAVFIFVNNLMGLVPGLAPPTQNLNTNLAMSVVVFLFYNVVGIKENGLAYLKHFLGPLLLLAPLMLVIELIGHAFRPVSLAVRLTGNMTGDHMVLGVFGDLAGGIFAGLPILLPVPFLFLGLLVSVIQTLVFCLLSTIYIALAVEHSEDH